MQYAAIVKNLLHNDDQGNCKGANYVVTGLWSNQCFNQAKRMFKPTESVNTSNTKFKHISAAEEWHVKKDASFVHYAQNETVHGFQFHEDDTDSAFPFSLF